MTTNSNNNNGTGSIVTLITEPPCFGLPSLSLESTAVETIFKLGKIEHIVHRQQQSQNGDDDDNKSFIIDSRVRDAVLKKESAVYTSAMASTSNSSSSSSRGGGFLSFFSSSNKNNHNNSSHQISASASSSILLEHGDFLPSPIVYDAAAFGNKNNNNNNNGVCWPPHLASSHASVVSRLDESLNDDESATSYAVTKMIRTSLMPAIELLWLADDGDFNTHVADIWERKRVANNNKTEQQDDNEENNNNVGGGRSLWDRLLRPVSAMRHRRIAKLKAVGGFANADEAFTALEQGLLTIEKFLAAARRREPNLSPSPSASGSSKKAKNATASSFPSTEEQKSNQKQQVDDDQEDELIDPPRYFFGRKGQPSSVDGFVFAVASAIVLGQFTSSSPLRAFQNQAIFYSSSSSTNNNNRNINEFRTMIPSTSVRLPLLKHYVEDLSNYFKKVSSLMNRRNTNNNNSENFIYNQQHMAKYFISITDLSSKYEKEREDEMKRKNRNKNKHELDPFQAGREETIFAIGFTLFAYVMLANWKSIKQAGGSQ